LAVSAGANIKAVQRMLGHAKASITLDVYADLFDEDLDGVAVRLDRPLGRPLGRSYPNCCGLTADCDRGLTGRIALDLLKLCGAKGIRTPDLLDANESISAFAA
jgi:hypothetical protein